MAGQIKQSDKCARCGRPLRDPVSRAIGMGPECRGGSAKPNHRQVNFQKRVARGQAYAAKAPIIFEGSKPMIFTYTQPFWISNHSGAITDGERFRAWLHKNNLAIFPDELLQDLAARRDKITAILHGPHEFKPAEVNELINALLMINDEIKEMGSSQ